MPCSLFYFENVFRILQWYDQIGRRIHTFGWPSKIVGCSVRPIQSQSLSCNVLVRSRRSIYLITVFHSLIPISRSRWVRIYQALSLRVCRKPSCFKDWAVFEVCENNIIILLRYLKAITFCCFILITTSDSLFGLVDLRKALWIISVCNGISDSFFRNLFMPDHNNVFRRCWYYFFSAMKTFPFVRHEP